jgi:uncharacterized DUF497 family protein
LNYNFEWDPDKAQANYRKHRIFFETAATIFKDTKTLTIFDNTHSQREERWITIGISENGKILVVVHTFEEKDDVNFSIRIISARKATKMEIQQYQGELK